MHHSVHILLLFPAIAFFAGIAFVVLKVDDRIKLRWTAIMVIEVLLIASSILGLWIASRLLPSE